MTRHLVLVMLLIMIHPFVVTAISGTILVMLGKAKGFTVSTIETIDGVTLYITPYCSMTPVLFVISLLVSLVSSYIEHANRRMCRVIALIYAVISAVAIARVVVIAIDMRLVSRFMSELSILSSTVTIFLWLKVLLTLREDLRATAIV